MSLNNVSPSIASPFLKKVSMYVKEEYYSNFCTFEITSLVNDIILGNTVRNKEKEDI